VYSLQERVTLMNIQLDDKTVEALTAQAAARGLSLEGYLRFLAGNGDSVPANGAMALADQERLLDQLSKGIAGIPTLPDSFSRTDVYFDRD
jgi:hypothetical protein